MPELIFDCQDVSEISPQDETELGKRLQSVFESLPIGGDVTIRIGTEEESRQLNRTYRGKDYSTDVLSFPLMDELPDGTLYWGDIHIAYPVAVRQAHEADHTVLTEILILAVHGLLHLSGMDHEQDQGQMMSRQNAIVSRINVPQL